MGKRVLWAVIIVLYATAGKAQAVKIAVAANLQAVIKVLQADFEKRTGIQTTAIIGSSGKLTAQISNGAPYDIFLSADMKYPETLYSSGFAVARPVVYAGGTLILASLHMRPPQNTWAAWLLSDAVKHIAVANPALAPYGKAAEEALAAAGILEKIKPKLVYGESIAQVNTYITTGVADAGFTSQSYLFELPAGTVLHTAAINAGTYSAVKQGMVLLKRAAANKNANTFYRYLLSARAKQIFKKYGYK